MATNETNPPPGSTVMASSCRSASSGGAACGGAEPVIDAHRRTVPAKDRSGTQARIVAMTDHLHDRLRQNRLNAQPIRCVGDYLGQGDTPLTWVVTPSSGPCTTLGTGRQRGLGPLDARERRRDRRPHHRCQRPAAGKPHQATLFGAGEFGTSATFVQTYAAAC